MYIFINCNIADKNCKKEKFLDFEKRYYYNASLYSFILNIKPELFTEQYLNR